MPNGKIILFNNKLYYDVSVQPIVSSHLVVNEMYHSLPVNLSYNSFEQQRTATITGAVPIDINQIVFMAIQMGHDLQITKSVQSGSMLSLEYTHNLYGFSYTESITSDKNIHSVYDGNIEYIPPFGKMGNNQVIQYNISSVSTLQTIANINQAKFTIYGSYGQYYTNISGEIRYRIYCVTLTFWQKDLLRFTLLLTNQFI